MFDIGGLGPNMYNIFYTPSRMNMPNDERYAWWSLVAWIGIMFFLLMRFTTGVELLGNSLGLQIVEQSAARLLGIYISLIIAAIIAESVIAGAMAAYAATQGVESDERDAMIAKRASLASYWFVAIALNVIVFHVLASAAFGSPLISGLNLTSTTGIAFAILFVLVGAEVVNRAALIWNYRRS
jgi:hypothetical protein